MTVVRSNILKNATIRQNYIQGVKLLKQEFLGQTTTTFGIAGRPRQLSTYDMFVVWHHIAMTTFTPSNQSERNAAHCGPVFLPWHRFMLILFEQHLQRVLKNQNFGLPYWDWATDGEQSPRMQVKSALWGNQCMGGQGNPVTSGPFAFDPNDLASWRIRVEGDQNGRLRAVDRGLQRLFARRNLRVSTGISHRLPRKTEVQAALDLGTYDQPPWNKEPEGFRTLLEGWLPKHPYAALHNRVHSWVGGDMLFSTSPNDPVFFLNHCNVDRIWSAWLDRHGSTYIPDALQPIDLLGHRIDDQMHALLSPSYTPRQMLNVATIYQYDTLVVT